MMPINRKNLLNQQNYKINYLPNLKNMQKKPLIMRLKLKNQPLNYKLLLQRLNLQELNTKKFQDKPNKLH